MKAMEVNFREFITASRRTFTIPVYQRNYEWKEPECSKLFKDIENIAGGEGSHFVGTIVFVSSSNSNATWSEFTVIDGQQRITTAMLLLKAIHDATDNEDDKEEIWEEFLTNKHAKNERFRLKLKPIESDSAVWSDLMDGNDISNQSSNLWINYNFFREEIKKSKFSAHELFESVGKLEIVYIQLETGKENPQVIFESINSTGRGLTPGDLIRNFLLMNCDSQEKQATLYKNYWLKIEKLLTPDNIKFFIRDNLTMQNGTLVNKNTIYDAFKEYAQRNFRNKEEELLSELNRYAIYYSRCLFCNHSNPKLNYLLKQFYELNSFVAFELLLWFFDKCYDKHRLSESELFEVIGILLSYQYRRLLCKAQYTFSLSTNALNSTYVSLPREIGDAENIPEKLLEILANKGRTQTFPRDDVFKNAFQTLDIYNAKLANYTLYMIENAANTHERITVTDEITVEHIMPQKLSATWKAELGKDYEQIQKNWLHTIGNLTLSGYNSKLSNDSFSKKKEIYLTSNISISRAIANSDEWNATTIQKRAMRLFEKALNIWSLPSKYNDIAAKTSIDYSATYGIMDEVKVTGETPRSFLFFGDEVMIDSWKALFIGVLAKLYEYDTIPFNQLISHETFKARHLLEPSDSSYTYRSKSIKETCPGYYTETNYSAQDLLSFTQIAVEIYRLEDCVEFIFKHNPQKTTPIKSTSNNSIEQEFKNWIISTDRSENTANQYATILSGRLISTLNAQNIANVNLFEYSTTNKFNQIINRISELPNYNTINEEKHYSFSAALKAYTEFLNNQDAEKYSLLT